MLSRILTSCVFVLSCTIVAISGDLPPSIKKCKVNDNACILPKINEVFTKFPMGNEEIGLPNVKALPVKGLTIAEAKSDSPVQLNFKFLDFIVYGMDGLTTTRVAGFVKNVSVVDLDLKIPSMRLVGNYVANGKILILTLDGAGKGDIELIDSAITVKVKCSLEERNGKNYVKVKKINSKIQPRKMKVRLENLVKNNAVMTDAVNQVINENWADVWSELRPTINKVLSEVIKSMIVPVLEKLPYDDFYLED